MKTSYAVSVTPKVTIDASAGEHLQFTVMHEDIRTSIGGSGDVSSTTNDLTINSAQWANGVHTYQTSNALVIDCAGSSTNADMVVIKHSGFLYDAAQTSNKSSTASASTDLVHVQDNATSNQIATIGNNEAIVIPRPTRDLKLVSATANHVAVEVTIIGLVS